MTEDTKPEQEPVAWMHKIDCDPYGRNDFMAYYKRTPGYCIPLYTSPPKREWVALTREEINIIVDRYSDSCDVGGVCGVCDGVSVVDAAEAKLKEKNYD